MTVKIKHIVFDIGKVLVHWDAEIPYRRLIPDDEQRKWFLSTVCTSEWNLEQDRGRPWSEAEDLLIEKYPEHSELIRAFRRNWIETIPHCYEGTVAIMERLIAGGHDVTLLTNFNQDTYVECTEKFPFLNSPRGVTVSGNVGLVKPDQKIYQLHVKSFDLDNDTVLFFDDSAANIAGARDVGWYAEQYIDTSSIKSALSKYQIEY